MPRTYTPQDYNGDNYSDVVWRGNTGETHAWTVQNGKKGQDYNYGTTVPNDWKIVGHGDYDGDKYADVLWQHTDGRVGYSLNNKTGGLAQKADYPTNPGTNWTHQKHLEGDYTGDGKTDAVWKNADGSYAVWGNLGSGTQYNVYDLGKRDATWTACASGDYDKDGYADIWWKNTAGEHEVWYIKDGKVSTAYKHPTDAAWTPVGSADYNNDGYYDLLCRHSDGRTQAWTVQGNSITNKYDVGNPGADWSYAGTGYYNNDDYADILWKHSNGTVVTWYYQNDRTIGSETVGQAATDWQIY